MRIKGLKNTDVSLRGKTVALTGSTGGIGKELSAYLVELGANLLLLDRNSERSKARREELLAINGEAQIECIGVDLEDIDSVRSACNLLERREIDIFIHNAGAYSIPRKICSPGFDNVFQINFVSPYYMIDRLLPTLRERNGRVVVVGSIAHRYSRTDPKDIDFSGRKKASKVYGNAKRYLMFSLLEKFEAEDRVALAVTHPGITFTNITAHYPRLIFALIKHPMKIIFMKPRLACLSVLRGVFERCNSDEWIGPALFDVWGMPKKKRLRGIEQNERREIFENAEKILKNLKGGENSHE